ncbi:WD40-repeat-containing domain protein [Xylaria sp. FL1042]|nr:WD40-repeat-containing domain protein [Xylaria sp. FL1042]
MRLLERGCDGEFGLTKDLVGDKVPRYAILSHTWGPDTDEVTFEDLACRAGKNKPGYHKIRFCADQAQSDGLLYFWIDTCCINKANNAELAEAINSMFRWYRDAARCYVYLSDVLTTTYEQSGRPSNPPWQSAFRASRWFTRGWTLQELLAPKSVQFFARDGTLLGDKTSLLQLIHEITGVAVPALRGEPLVRFDVEERFKWAKRRQTTREEDWAYSLLGIFDIFIPPIYGEGKANAVRRLRKEISDALYREDTPGHQQEQLRKQVSKDNQQCLKDLRTTDPRDDKVRIEETKGGLLRDSYHWILDNLDFQRWRDHSESRLLWIKGDPGKGKTMLLCGIIDELKTSTPSGLLSFFFCQATDSRINNATAVLRGLIYLFVEQQPTLISHVRKKYDHTGKTLFEDPNAWVALSDIFANIMRDQALGTAYVVIDALDECVTDSPKLLDFIIRVSSSSTWVKWLLSSRNEPGIGKKLGSDDGQTMLSLELKENAEQVSRAVNAYVDDKLSHLESVRENDKLREQVRDVLRRKANGTFLWVSLVVQELEQVESWHVPKVAEEVPPGLDDLYDRMMNQIEGQKRDSENCGLVLSAVTVAYRPLHLAEIAVLSGLPKEIWGSTKNIAKIVAKCGSFLTVRDDQVYLVHQSAKEYLSDRASAVLFPSGVGKTHHGMFSRSLKLMSEKLRRNMYGLSHPGFPIDQVRQPKPDPLAAARYSCVHWVDHLRDWASGVSAKNGDDPQHVPGTQLQAPRHVQKWEARPQNDSGEHSWVYEFLREHFLHWLEALGLLEKTSEGVLAITTLESMTVPVESSALHALVRDAKRFALYSRSILDEAPLQVYCSALLFAPEASIVRKQFEGQIPRWIRKLPAVPRDWGSLLLTLEVRSDSTKAVSFSPDSQMVVSASRDGKIRLWSSTTGEAHHIFEGHSDSANAVVFSPDSKLIASASNDRTVRLWDSATGAALRTLSYQDPVHAVTFSSDGQLIVATSRDKDVMLWDSATGLACRILKGHSGKIRTVAFSPSGKIVASASNDKTLKVWDLATGTVHCTLMYHSLWVDAVVFSPDNKLLAASSDKTVTLWDLTGNEVEALYNLSHLRPVPALVFSADSKLIASGSEDFTVRLWDSATGAKRGILTGHSRPVMAVAFSPDGKLVASGCWDDVKIWNLVTATAGTTLDMPKGRPIHVVVFSPNGRLVASVSGNTIKLSDSATGTELHMLRGHDVMVDYVIFSPDSKMVASTAFWTVKIWNPDTGEALCTLKHPHPVYAVAFSLDGKLLASASGGLDASTSDVTVRLWNLTRGGARTLQDHLPRVNVIAFSPNGRLVAYASDDGTVRLWDWTGEGARTLEGHLAPVNAIAFSPDGRLVASASKDETVRTWDPVTGATHSTLVVNEVIRKLSFSSNGSILETDIGQLSIHSLSPMAPLQSWPSWYLHVKGDWVLQGQERILRLPPDYRVRCAAAQNNILVLGHELGNISFIEFNPVNPSLSLGMSPYMAMQMENACIVCGNPGKLCTGCEKIAYCGKEHQMKDWKKHKGVCKIKGIM